MLRFKLREQPFFIRIKLGWRAAKLVAPGDAAARLDSMGCRNIRRVHQQAWRKPEGVKAGVGLLHHLPGNFQRGIAHVNTVTGFQVQKRH